MRIAYVVNSMEGGGAAMLIPAIARELECNDSRVKVFALTRRDGRSTPPIEAAGLPLTVRDGGEKDHLAAARWFSRVVAQEAPDLIWTSLTRATLIGQAVGRRHGIPVVSWQHNAYLRPTNRMLLRLSRFRSALWIADSESVAHLTRERLHVPAERLATWPIFAADECARQARPWRGGETIRLGSLGRLNARKGYDVLIEALAKLGREGFRAPAPFVMEIAGEGALRERLEAMAERRGLSSVRFVGFQAEPQVFLAGLHLYLQPSRAEGFCIAAHEAMQAGVPVIATDVGEMPHTVDEGRTGHIVPPRDADALAACLRSVLSRPYLLESMGRAARERVFDLFGAENFARAGKEVFDRLPRREFSS